MGVRRTPAASLGADRTTRNGGGDRYACEEKTQILRAILGGIEKKIHDQMEDVF